MYVFRYLNVNSDLCLLSTSNVPHIFQSPITNYPFLPILYVHCPSKDAQKRRGKKKKLRSRDNAKLISDLGAIPHSLDYSLQGKKNKPKPNHRKIINHPNPKLHKFFLVGRIFLAAFMFAICCPTEVSLLLGLVHREKGLAGLSNHKIPWSSNIPSLQLETRQKATSNYPLSKTPGNSWTSKLLPQLCVAKKVRHAGATHVPACSAQGVGLLGCLTLRMLLAFLWDCGVGPRGSPS